MQLSEIPTKFQITWGADASGSYIRVVPISPPAQVGAASWEQGFPPITFVQVSAGGSPPFGQDINGVLQEITAWSQWAQAGGAQPFDASFASAIGGYPKSCLLPAGSQAGVWYNLADNNSANPDTGGSNWVLIGPGMALGGDLSGTVGDAIINDGVISTAMMIANAVTNPVLAQMAAATVKANLTGGTANPQDVTLPALVAALGLTGNLAVKGHISLNLGAVGTFILNWGYSPLAGGFVDVTFDQPFGTPFCGLSTANGTPPSTVENLTATGMTVNAGGDATDVNWIALGKA